jgi:hypothetical protein
MAAIRVCRDLVFLAFVGSTGGALGCGGGRPPTGEVSGKILIMGESPKIKGLHISFIAPSGRIVGAPINEDGTYQADVPAGEAKIGFIFVSPGTEHGAQKKNRFPGKGAPDGPVQASQETVPNPIPEPLRDGSTSNLRVEVVAGQKQVFDYDVK